MSQRLSPLLVPLVEKKYQFEKLSKKTKNNNEAMIYYNELSEIFKNPQKIVSVSGSELLLENKIVLYVFGNSNPEKFESFVRENVLNKEVKIYLVDFDEFSLQYFNNRSSRFKNSERNTHFRMFSALIVFQEELINLRFSSTDFLIEKYPELSRESLVGTYEHLNNQGQIEKLSLYKGVSDDNNLFFHKTFQKGSSGDVYDIHGGSWTSIVSYGGMDSATPIYFLKYEFSSSSEIKFMTTKDGIQCVSSNTSNIKVETIYKKIQ